MEENVDDDETQSDSESDDLQDSDSDNDLVDSESDEDEDDETEFEIESIISHRLNPTKPNGFEVEVKWLGYEETSFEPTTYLEELDIFKEYVQNQYLVFQNYLA